MGGVAKYFEKVMDSVISDRYPDILIYERSVQPDHVHIFLEIPPKYSVASVVGSLKAHTARKMRKKFGYLAQASSLWSVGYFVSTVGTNEVIIKNYIRRQEKQDTGRSQIALGKIPRA